LTVDGTVIPLLFPTVFHLPDPSSLYLLIGKNTLEEMGWTATAGIKALAHSTNKAVIKLVTSRHSTVVFTAYLTSELAEASKPTTPLETMTAAEVHELTGHGGDDCIAGWAKLYRVKLTDTEFTSAKCHTCLISNIEKAPVQVARDHPTITSVDKSTCLIMDFNVWLGAQNPGTARSGNRQLLNVIHPRSLTVMTAGTKTTKDCYDNLRVILTRLLNHLRKHGHVVDTIYCDKESVFLSSRMHKLIAVDFNVTILPAPTDNHCFMGEVKTFNRVQAYKV
jgi:hypothetical protein